jgi:hypothetical protein
VCVCVCVYIYICMYIYIHLLSEGLTKKNASEGLPKKNAVRAVYTHKFNNMRPQATNV